MIEPNSKLKVKANIFIIEKENNKNIIKTRYYAGELPDSTIECLFAYNEKSDSIPHKKLRINSFVTKKEAEEYLVTL